MQKLAVRLMSTLLALALCACASPEPCAQACPKLQEVPPEVMVKREPNFRDRLLRIFSTSSTTPTPSSVNSQHVKP